MYWGGRGVAQNCSILDMLCWYLLLFIDHAPVHKAQDAVGLLRCQGTRPAHVQLAFQDAQVVSRGLHPKLSVPNLSHCQGLFLPRCRTQHLSLLNFTSFFSAHFSNPSRSLWMAALLVSLPSSPPICCPLQTWWECTPLPPQGHWSRELLAVKFIFTIISKLNNLISLINFSRCISMTLQTTYECSELPRLLWDSNNPM